MATVDRPNITASASGTDNSNNNRASYVYNYSLEVDRRTSFADFRSHLGVLPNEIFTTLARIGFFYDNRSRQIKCHVCYLNVTKLISPYIRRQWRETLQRWHGKWECWFPDWLHFDEQHGVRPFQSLNHMRFQANRVCSFKDWSCYWWSPFHLAWAGFFSVRKDGFAMCAFCYVLVNFEKANHAWDVNHHLSRCKYGGNGGGRSYTCCPGRCSGSCRSSCYGGGDWTWEPAGNVSIPVSLILKKKNVFAMIRQEEYPPKNGIQNLRSANTDIAMRLKTFEDWPGNNRGLPTARSLASKGFIYTGVGDHVNCIDCGLGLHRWRHDDDVESIHMYWSPQCPRVNIDTGKNDFIHKSKRKRDPDRLYENVNDGGREGGGRGGSGRGDDIDRRRYTFLWEDKSKDLPPSLWSYKDEEDENDLEYLVQFSDITHKLFDEIKNRLASDGFSKGSRFESILSKHITEHVKDRLICTKGLLYLHYNECAHSFYIKYRMYRPMRFKTYIPSMVVPGKLSV